MAVSFLAARVKRKNEYYWGKMKRVLNLKGANHMKLNLKVDYLSVVNW